MHLQGGKKYPVIENLENLSVLQFYWASVNGHINVYIDIFYLCTKLLIQQFFTCINSRNDFSKYIEVRIVLSATLILKYFSSVAW